MERKYGLSPKVFVGTLLVLTILILLTIHFVQAVNIGQATGGVTIAPPPALISNNYYNNTYLNQTIVNGSSYNVTYDKFAYNQSNVLYGQFGSLWINWTTSVTSFPTRVANYEYMNQTASVGQIVIYTPTQSGMYRVSAYQVVDTSGTAGTLATTIQWTGEDGGHIRQPVANLNTAVLSSFDEGTIYIRSKGAKEINVSSVLTGVVGNPTYDLFVSVERIS